MRCVCIVTMNWGDVRAKMRHQRREDRANPYVAYGDEPPGAVMRFAGRRVEPEPMAGHMRHVFENYQKTGVSLGVGWMAWLAIVAVFGIIVVIGIVSIHWTNENYDQYQGVEPVGVMKDMLGACGRGTVAAMVSDMHWECVVRADTAVDKTLVRESVSACDSFALRACGGWEGAPPQLRDRTFDAAWATAQRTLPRVMDRAVVAGTGAFHDFVLSCVSGLSADVPAADEDDKLFATEVVDSLFPSPDASPVFQLAYAAAYAVGYGAQPIFGMHAVPSPLRSSEAVISWTVGSTVNIINIVGGSTRLRDFMLKGCHALTVIGRFPADLYISEDACADDMLALYLDVYDVAQRATQAAPQVTFAYLQNGAQADTVTPDQFAAEVASAEFVGGVVSGLTNSFARYGGVLANASVVSPTMSTMRHWVRMRAYIGEIYTTWAGLEANATQRWMTFMRVAFLLDGMQYTMALAQYEADHAALAPALRASHARRFGHARVRTTGRTIGVPPQVSTPAPAPLWLSDLGARRVVGAVRANESDHGLVNTQLWKDCVWLAVQFLPSVVNTRYAEATLAPARTQAAAGVVREVMAALSADTPHVTRAAEKAEHMRVRIASARHTDEPAARRAEGLPYFLSPRHGLWRNVALARQRQLVSDAVEPQLDMPTFVANAYYRPERNDITLLAGILDDVFFREDMANASRFGRLGAIVGHELTHGFDTQGILFDAFGTFSPWLSQEEHEAEETMAVCLLEQYRTHTTPRWHTKVNAAATLDENMADVLGLRASFLAFERSTELALGRTPRREEIEEFLLAYAQTWCTAETAADERGDARVDVHAPAMARIDGALRNLVDDAGRHVLGRVYRCEPGEAMRPEAVCGSRT